MPRKVRASIKKATEAAPSTMPSTTSQPVLAGRTFTSNSFEPNINFVERSKSLLGSFHIKKAKTPEGARQIQKSMEKCGATMTGMRGGFEFWGEEELTHFATFVLSSLPAYVKQSPTWDEWNHDNMMQLLKLMQEALLDTDFMRQTALQLPPMKDKNKELLDLDLFTKLVDAVRFDHEAVVDKVWLKSGTDNIQDQASGSEETVNDIPEELDISLKLTHGWVAHCIPAEGIPQTYLESKFEGLIEPGSEGREKWLAILADVGARGQRGAKAGLWVPKKSPKLPPITNKNLFQKDLEEYKEHQKANGMNGAELNTLEDDRASTIEPESSIGYHDTEPDLSNED